MFREKSCITSAVGGSTCRRWCLKRSCFDMVRNRDNLSESLVTVMFSATMYRILKSGLLKSWEGFVVERMFTSGDLHLLSLVQPLNMWIHFF